MKPTAAFPAHLPGRELDLETARACVVERTAAHVARALRPLPRELCALDAALGRVLAENVLADRDAPPFRRALRDGYALRAGDGIPPGGELRLIGEVRAGQESRLRIEPGECAAIMTGASVPAGADAVVMVERTERRGNFIGLASGPASAGVPEPAARRGDHIAEAGSDIAAGEVMVAAGGRLRFAELAALASVGCLRPSLYLPPRIALIASGDELVEADEAPGPMQIRNSNAYGLCAQARRAGAAPVVYPRVPDRMQALEAALDRALAETDLVVFHGGASVGAYDLVPELVKSRGAEVYFDAVRMRPGRPVWFGRMGDHLFFGLPGNPLGAMLGFELLVRPALEVLAGVPPGTLPTGLPSARLGFDYRGAGLDLTMLRPGQLRPAGLCAEIHDIPYRGSADLRAAAAADGFWIVPNGVTELARGTKVELVLK